MSRFLAPVHQWLYGKIRFQDQLTAHLARVAKQEGWLADETPFRTDDRPLEEAIDPTDIHGWLQGRIDGTETRLAALATSLLDEDAARRETLEKAAYAFGQAHRVEPDADPAAVWHRFDDTLLDGMPCDRVNLVRRGDDGSVSWKRTKDPHAPYWKDPEVYHALRRKVAEGMLDGCAYTVRQDGDDFAIIPREAPHA